MRIAFLILISSFASIESKAISSDTTPQFYLGAGLGLSKSGQNTEGAQSASGMGLSGTVAYSPIPNWFIGFDIDTFSPVNNVRVSNYLGSVLYRFKKITAGILTGIQAVNDGRADGSLTDPLTGNVLAKNTSSLAYGIKVSYDKIWDIKRDDFNIGLSPVLFIIKAPNEQNFNQVLLMAEFRIYGYSAD